MPRRTIKLLVRVDAPNRLTPQQVADTVNALINAGLSDAADSAELAEEDQLIDPTDALDLNIHAPKVIGK